MTSRNHCFILAFVCALVVALAPTLHAQNLTAGLVGWWPGDDSTADIANNLATNSAATNVLYDNGVNGRCFSFNGSTNQLVVDSATLATPFVTVEGWFYLHASSQAEPVLASRYDFYQGWHLRLSASGSVKFRVHRLPDQTSPVVESAPLALQTWYHIAATYDGAELRLYVNGVAVQPVPYLGGMSPAGTGTSLYLGNASWAPGGGSRFTGKIDEFSLYNRALSPSEIQSLFTSPNQTRPKAPQITTQLPTQVVVPSGEKLTLQIGAVGLPPLQVDPEIWPRVIEIKLWRGGV